MSAIFSLLQLEKQCKASATSLSRHELALALHASLPNSCAKKHAGCYARELRWNTYLLLMGEQGQVLYNWGGWRPSRFTLNHTDIWLIHLVILLNFRSLLKTTKDLSGCRQIRGKPDQNHSCNFFGFYKMELRRKSSLSVLVLHYYCFWFP